MRNSKLLSDATHIMLCVDLFNPDQLSSSLIAASVNTNPVVVRRIMSKLKTAGLLETVSGKAVPTLTRSLENITLLDVYLAVDGAALLHIDELTNKNCVIGGQIGGTLLKYYDKVQLSAYDEMAKITLKDISNDLILNQ
ncbi:hypothetical protein LH61_06375 [Leuconostoc mesenteroides P45]|uniref:Rrf2 family transcriptional regulator n=1 Tax=Leuconostoc mesenteroides TaxID=1245 RepID=UPI0005042367|nr:Rrf2 family transcriptional regulator [Leuconostoc mesenteroides]KGB51096.1 hypothetical protein LH61_06375 [Leuconostoc mesenteroides P45]